MQICADRIDAIYYSRFLDYIFDTKRTITCNSVKET